MKPRSQRYDWKDYLIRLTFIAAGGVAAILLAQTGDAEALPPMAIGGVVGAALAGGIFRRY